MTGDTSGAKPAAWACAGMIAVFVALAWAGVREKTATVDEPMEGVSGYAVARDGELRAGIDTPPLAKRWAMLLQPRDALDLAYEGPAWDAVLRGTGTWEWTRGAFLAAGPDRADAFLARARAMMLVLGAALCAVTTRWAWEAAGPAAGVAAAVLVCFDPNLLGNASLVKTDVALALAFATAGWATWHVGRDGRAGWVALMAAAAGAGPAVKFSGVMLPALVCATLLARVFVGGEWRVAGRAFTTRRGRAAAWAGMCALVGVASAMVVWAAYGFRSGTATAEPKDPVGAAAVALAERGIVPRVWAAGLAQQRGQAAEWPAYLLGEYSRTGWWYYFPVAWAVKEPVGTVAAVVVAAAWGLRSARTARATLSDEERAKARWTTVAVAIPAAAYAAAAMAANVNAGLRHFMVVLPFLYVGIGIVAARAVARSGPRARRVSAALAATIIAEVALACPHYLAFFNVPARQHRMTLLGDANLDWGQDLKGLVAWQRANPGVRLYAAYFGVTPPWFYGLRYEPMPGVPFFYEPAARWPAGPGVMAVSATIIQGIYAPEDRRGVYRKLMAREPLKVIGGTIYLYETNGGMP